MRRSFCGGLLGAVVIALSATGAAAQETGTPIFKAPYRSFTSHEFGASFSDPGEGVSFALEGFYRYGRGSNDFSLRGGFEDLNGAGGTRILVGGDFRTQILSYSESVPVDGSLTVGLGANVGDGRDAYYIPVGISIGRRFDLEGSNTTFIPYAHPVIVPTFGGGDSEVNFALGLGVDVRFSREWAVRVSGGIGDIEGVGVSLTYLH
jgi:hypothetical protein